MVVALAAAVRQAPYVQVMTDTTVWDLLLTDGRVVGALAHTPAGWVQIHAAAVVLATGGMGQLFARTTNPSESTGDGVAMALRAGADVADLEFIQFHPTALALDDATTLPLLTEALRGEGARLCDESGHFFMTDEHPLAELAPRDVVARAIWARVAAGKKVFLDATGLPDVERRFPTVAALVAEHGYRLGTQPIPVTPAAHYAMGGVWTDAHGRTSLPGLYACGETAATGVHGANRLASNSLLECVVFGRRVAIASATEVLRPAARAAVPVLSQGAQGATVRRQLQQLMFQGAGLVRTGSELQKALTELRRLAAMSHGQGGSVRAQAERRNLFTVGAAVLEAALERTESRGAHSRADYPATDRAWQRRSLRVAERQPQPRKVRP
jgi:L-aspartate oxidase